MKTEDKHKVKAWLLSRYKSRCCYCDAELTYEKATIDHYLPKFHGGTNKRDNLRLSCHPCNALKANMTPWEWILYREKENRNG